MAKTAKNCSHRFMTARCYDCGATWSDPVRAESAFGKKEPYIKDGTTRERSFQKKGKVEQDWEKEFEERYRGAVIIYPKAYCDDMKRMGLSTIIDLSCYEKVPNLGFDSLKSFISHLLELKEREVVERTIEFIKSNEYEYIKDFSSRIKKVVNVKLLLNFLNKEYKLKK